MDKNTILAKIHKRFSSLPHLKIYKAWSEQLQLLIKNKIPIEIHCLIKVKVQLAGKLPLKFSTYIIDYGKINHSRKQRARRL